MSDCLKSGSAVESAFTVYKSKTLIRPQLKPIRILVEELKFVLFEISLLEYLNNDADLEVKLALEALEETSSESSTKIRSTQCVLAELSECPGKGETPANDLEKFFERIERHSFKAWFDSTQRFLEPPIVGSPWSSTVRSYVRMLSDWHNCVEDSIRKSLVCKDVTCARVRVPCIVERCLDDK